MGYIHFLKYALYYVNNERMNKTHFRTLRDLKQFVLNEDIKLYAIIKTEKNTKINLFDNGFNKWVTERDLNRFKAIGGLNENP